MTARPGSVFSRERSHDHPWRALPAWGMLLVAWGLFRRDDQPRSGRSRRGHGADAARTEAGRGRGGRRPGTLAPRALGRTLSRQTDLRRTLPRRMVARRTAVEGGPALSDRTVSLRPALSRRTVSRRPAWGRPVSRGTVWRGTVLGGAVVGAAVLGLTTLLVTAAPPASAAAPASTAVWGSAAVAHPLGNFTVSRYDGLTVAPGEIRVDHVEDLAEIPTTQAQPRVDALGLPAWAAERCGRASAAIKITADRVAGVARARVRSAAARSRPGQAGLSTLRVECRITAQISGTSIVFRDEGAVAGAVGWHEITATGDRVTLTASDVPTVSRSARLTNYPQDMLSSPLDQRSATLRVRPGGSAQAASPGSPGSSMATPTGGVVPRGADRLTQTFTDLVAHRRLSPGFALLALAIALALGGLHALAPGHGKTIMAAYAVGGGARARRDVLTLGVTVTITHTAGVLTLGLFIATGTAYAPAAVYPWLGIASGVLVAFSGVVLLRRAVRARRGHHHHAHAPALTHGHGHGHGQGHGHGHSHGHGHPHGHTHGHGHGHGRDGGSAAGAEGRGGAALMGFAGGLVPSPSAVVVLVGAAAIGQAWFGVLLVLGYGVGLACTLIVIGLFIVGSGRVLARRLTSRGGGRRALLARAALPFGSATAVVVLGVGLVVRSVPGALA
jgi:nickel/cobalt transporter (NicO) family protein